MQMFVIDVFFDLSRNGLQRRDEINITNHKYSDVSCIKREIGRHCGFLLQDNKAGVINSTFPDSYHVTWRKIDTAYDNKVHYQ